MKICKLCSKSFKPKSSRNPNYYCGMDCYQKTRKGKNRVDFRYSWGYRYVFTIGHPHANDGRYVAEHRLVMEKQIGRYLIPNEVVHHKNHDKLDNRIENLILCTRKVHNEHHQSWIPLQSPTIKRRCVNAIRAYHRNRLVEWSCINCGTTKMKTPFQSKHRKFCSRKCNAKYKLIHWKNQFGEA